MLPRTIASIWPLPFGLLLQQAAEVHSPTQSIIPFSCSSPLLGVRDVHRRRRETSHSPQHNLNFLGGSDYNCKGDTGSISSHLILKDPLEEPQVCDFCFTLVTQIFALISHIYILCAKSHVHNLCPWSLVFANVHLAFPVLCLFLINKFCYWKCQLTFIEERGKLNIMKEFDERTIWTSDQIPLMASYNKGFLCLSCSQILNWELPLYKEKLLMLSHMHHFWYSHVYAGKMQHSVWVAEAVNSNLELANSSSADVVPAGVLPKQFSFRRIWQGKGAQTAASKVSMYLLIFVSFEWIFYQAISYLYLIIVLLHLVF